MKKKRGRFGRFLLYGCLPAFLALLLLIIGLGVLGAVLGSRAPARPPAHVERPAGPNPIDQPVPRNTPHDAELDKRLMKSLQDAKTGQYKDGSTPRDEYIEPSIREFGDANGNSWIDPHTFTDNKTPPATWSPPAPSK
jgi:hypothetical protein